MFFSGPPMRNRIVRVPDPNDQSQMIDQLLFPDNAKRDSAEEMVIDLRAQGNANAVLGMIFNSLFILGLNQE
jgi:hypothetical protein